MGTTGICYPYIHIQKNVGHYQHFRGNAISIGEFKREVESGVATSVQLGGKIAYGSAIVEPFLTAEGETLETYFAIYLVQQAPYEALHKDMIVTIIMLKNFGYDSIWKWLSKQHMGPITALAYPTVSVKLVDMMNSGNFKADQIKPAGKKNKTKNKNKDKDKEEETVGAIVEQAEQNTNTPSN